MIHSCYGACNRVRVVISLIVNGTAGPVSKVKRLVALFMEAHGVELLDYCLRHSELLELLAHNMFYHLEAQYYV